MINSPKAKQQFRGIFLQDGSRVMAPRPPSAPSPSARLTAEPPQHWGERRERSPPAPPTTCPLVPLPQGSRSHSLNCPLVATEPVQRAVCPIKGSSLPQSLRSVRERELGAVGSVGRKATHERHPSGGRKGRDGEGDGLALT